MSYTKLLRWMTRAALFAVLVFVLVGWKSGVTSTQVQLSQKKEPSPPTEVKRTFSAFELAGFDPVSPAFTQNQTPSISALNVFDPDLADVKEPNLIAAIKQLKAQAKCRPPRITFKVIVAQNPADKDFSNALAEGRKEALEQYLGGSTIKSLLDPDQYKSKVTAEVIPNVPYPDAGQVTLNFEQFNDQDKDPPKLKDITWNPSDGAVVSEGQQIEVTVTASEKYEDGHKSWPTGVKSITLVAIGNKVSEWPNPSPDSPKPCERVTWQGTYTVPKTSSSTITLCVVAEDYTGHRSSQCAKFNILPPPVMPANCKRKGYAKLGFIDGSPVGDPSKGIISCNFRWTICGKEYIKTKLVENAAGVCKSFFDSEKAALTKEEFCCDCYPNCGAQRKPKE